jgi:hypothetical protein
MVFLCISSEFNFARAFAKGMASPLLLFPRGSLRDWPVKKSRFFFLDKKETKNQDLQEKPSLREERSDVAISFQKVLNYPSLGSSLLLKIAATSLSRKDKHQHVIPVPQ